MKPFVLIILFLSLLLYGAYMRGVQLRNFDNIPQSYPDIAIDTTEGIGSPLIDRE